MAKRRARPILEDLLAYAEEAVSYVENRDGPTLAADRMRMLAVNRAVEIVGEAANQLPKDVLAAFPAIDFASAIAMRHRLIHGYDSVSAEIVSDTVRNEFPKLIIGVRAALAGRLPDEPATA
jgi:uncharacterized protein with HEPN domain